MSGRALTAGGALLLLALLAGCTASPQSAPTSASSTPTPTPTPACIVGAWSTDAAQLQSAYDALPRELDYPTAAIDQDATVDIVFDADGAFTFAQDVAATLTWMDHPAAVSLGGTLSGTYETAGDALTLTPTANGLSVEPRDDRRASLLFAAATQETLSEWPVSAQSFTCDDGRLVLDLETEGHVASVAFVRG